MMISIEDLVVILSAFKSQYDMSFFILFAVYYGIENSFRKLAPHVVQVSISNNLSYFFNMWTCSIHGRWAKIVFWINLRVPFPMAYGICWIISYNKLIVPQQNPNLEIFDLYISRNGCFIACLLLSTEKYFLTLKKIIKLSFLMSRKYMTALMVAINMFVCVHWDVSLHSRI